MSTNLKRITFGIPSYNEEVNISNILHLIIGLNRESQSRNRNSSGHGNGEIDKKRSENKGLNFKEEFIIAEIIISDDSSDNTCRIVEAISAENLSVNIKLLHHNTRRGVSSAWNEIFKIATGDIIVLYDADIIIDRNTTANLVESIDNGIGLCASNSTPLLLEKSRISRASKFVAEWLSRVRNNGLSQYTVMGRALSISSHVAKSITIPENVIALDLYLQCKVLELGFKVVYNEQALVYFRPPDNMEDFSSQIIRAINGHKQIQHLLTGLCPRLTFRRGLIAALKGFLQDPKGAVCLMSCYSLLPYYMAKLANTNSVKWHIAKSTKNLN